MLCPVSACRFSSTTKATIARPRSLSSLMTDQLKIHQKFPEIRNLQVKTGTQTILLTTFAMFSRSSMAVFLCPANSSLKYQCSPHPGLDLAWLRRPVPCTSMTLLPLACSTTCPVQSLAWTTCSAGWPSWTPGTEGTHRGFPRRCC